MDQILIVVLEEEGWAIRDKQQGEQQVEQQGIEQEETMLHGHHSTHHSSTEEDLAKWNWYMRCH